MNRRLASLGVMCLLLGSSAHAQVATPAQPPQIQLPSQAGATPAGATPATPEESILAALQSDPLTAPYRIAVRREGQQYVLSGRVGSTAAHNEAVRLLIRMGYPVRDELVTDTRLQDVVNINVPGFSMSIPAYGVPQVSVRSGLPYTYPSNIYSRFVNPFLGFQPPVVTFPPRIQVGPLTGQPQQQAPDANQAPDPDMPNGVQLNIDPTTGEAVVRGQVPSEAARDRILQQVATAPGVTKVVNELEVAATTDRPSINPNPAGPPPPPAPALREPLLPVEPTDTPRNPAPAKDALAARVGDSIARRPALVGERIRVTTRDGVVTLTGQVPSAYEAMLAFRAAQQTPGVRDVQDRLEFAMPDDDQQNPLRTKARPEDAEPYLTAQIRRQLGDLAYVDPVRIRGDAIEIRGTVARQADVARAEAILKAVPLLRGFRLEPSFSAD